MQQTLEGLVQVGDHFVEEDVLRIVQKVSEYDENLRIRYLPPDRVINPSQAPYALVERGKDGVWRVVFYIWELDDRIMDRIVAMDTFKQDVLGNLDKNNQKARDTVKKEGEELREEAREKTKAIIDSPKDTYTVPVGDRIVKFSSIPRDDRA